MSHLFWIYTVCPLVFEFSIRLNMFSKFADENFAICFLVVKELKNEIKSLLFPRSKHIDT